MQQKITPNLWFDGNAKQAVEYYVAVFPNSKVLATQYYPESQAEGLADFQIDMAGKELYIEFTLNGQKFGAINADSTFKLSEAVSFAVACDSQKEIDYYWEKLSSVPESEQCGWCKDKFGLSWQIVPANMEDLMKKPGAYGKMMKMKKLVIDQF